MLALNPERRIRLAKPSLKKKDDFVRSLMQALRVPPEGIRKPQEEPLPLTRRTAVAGMHAAVVLFASFSPQAPEAEKTISDFRYIEDIFFSEGRLEEIRATARGLGITPRELEIMLFYVYSDFDMRLALRLGRDESDGHIVSEASMHLACDDAMRLLRSSYYIYSLRNRELEPASAYEMASALWADVRGMSKSTSYSLKFFNEAYHLRAVFSAAGPEHFHVC